MTTQQIIEEKLVGGFDLQHLQVINESGQHNVPDGSESHFKVVLVQLFLHLLILEIIVVKYLILESQMNLLIMVIAEGYFLT